LQDIVGGALDVNGFGFGGGARVRSPGPLGSRTALGAEQTRLWVWPATTVTAFSSGAKPM
jgi:hypothetical protein